MPRAKVARALPRGYAVRRVTDESRDPVAIGAESEGESTDKLFKPPEHVAADIAAFVERLTW